MFQAIFETFFGLMSLYNVTSGNMNYHKMVSVWNQLSPMTPQATAYWSEEKSSATSVTFMVDDTTEVFLRDNRENYERHSTYFFYYQFEDEVKSAGSLNFALQLNSSNHYNFKIYSAPYDKFNLRANVLIEFYTATNTYTYDTCTFDFTQSTEVETSYNFSIPSLDIDYFDDGGKMYITIQTEPINEEQWDGRYTVGYDDGYDSGYGQGHQDGFSEGYQTAIDSGSTAATIFSGIVTVGLLPVNFFLGIMNFEVFGINIGAFISALLTIAIIIIVIKIIIGSQTGGAS